MKTYQNLLEKNETEYGAFCKTAVEELQKSRDYRTAQTGEAYYAGHNTTIEQYQKLIYTLSGAARQDPFGADYRLKTLFFRRLIVQMTQYICGNGAMLRDVKNKEKLGKTFDRQLAKAVKHAQAAGRAFLFWNLDHVEVFCYAETRTEPGFCPLYDEDTGLLMAGIRFWKTKAEERTIYHYTLYTPEGYTEYKEDKKRVEMVHPLKPYRIKRTVTAADGVLEEIGQNYSELPIVPLYSSDTRESEIVKIQESSDCYDLVKSGLANQIDDGNGFYWVIKNAGGMDDPDLARFIQRIKTTHAAALDDDQSAEAHTMDIPYNARAAMLEILRKDIYRDFQALDVESLSAAQKTTQEIQAAYQIQDNRAADLEYEILTALDKILALAGMPDEEVTFTWQKVVNMTEQTNMILSAAPYLPDEMTIKKLPFLTPEEAEEAIAALEAREAAEYAESLTDEDETAPEEEADNDNN